MRENERIGRRVDKKIRPSGACAAKNLTLREASQVQVAEQRRDFTKSLWCNATQQSAQS